MVRIQLENGYLDVKEGAAFPLNFAIGDIRDISQRSGNFSKTVTLIGNSNNHNLLNHYYDVNIQAGTFNVNTLTYCDVIENGVPVMINATLQLINIKKSQVTGAYEQIVEYEVLLKEAKGSFFTDISNKYLTDLDLSDLDHVVDASVVIDSFDNTLVDGYKYVMPFYTDDEYRFEWFKPGVYAQVYFDRIFQTAGYSYTWAGLEDAGFDKLLIPYNGDKNVVDWTDYKVVAEKAAFSELKTQTILGTANWTAINQYPMEARNLTTGWSETLDAQNLFNTTNGQYTTPQWVGDGSGDSYVYEVSMAGELFLNFNTSVRLYPDGTAAYKVFLRVKVGNSPNVKCYLPDFIYNDDVNYFATPTVISLGTFNHIFTFNATTDGSGGIDVGDIQIMQIGVDVLNTFVLGEVFNTFIYWQPQSGTTPQTPNINLDITNFNVTIRPSDGIPLNSGITTMNDFIPEKIKQSDYIKSIFMMFNLYALPDPNSETNIILLHRDEYYDSGKAVDWSSLLMKDKEQSLVFIPELNTKKMRLTYKADTDDPNKVYTDVTKEIYGQAEITFENEYVKGIDVKELLFSPTPIQPTVFGAFLPLLNGAAPKTNIRILVDNGELTAQPITIMSGYDTETTTAGEYPYLSHFGGPDALNPTSDINFATCDFYYYQVAQNTDNNLYNRYWRRTVAQINGGKMLTAYFYLRESDIHYMELNDKIRIDNSWWSINKVIDYNANNEQPTKVELISLDTEIDLPAFFGGTTTPVGPGDGSQIASIMQEYNQRTNVTTNNVNAIILGSGNVVGDRLNALVVGSGHSVEQDGIATNNLRVTETLNGRAISDILPTYTKYIALITQSGTAAPTVNILENTIGEIVWTRNSVGLYYGTLTGAFPDATKVYTMISNSVKDGIVMVRRATADRIEVETTNLQSPTAAHHDTHLSNNTIEIRIYE